VATAPGVRVRPILSAGDVVGGDLLGYQMTGIPDGIGAYRSSPSTVEVLVNHELDGQAPEGVGARVSQLTLDDRRPVLAGRYLRDGSEGFLRFYSATLAKLDGVPWYFTGEESTDQGEPTDDGDAGTSQLYAYTAASFTKAIAGHGRLWVWAADATGDGNPSTDDITRGQTLPGHLVPLSQADNADAATLEAAAQAKGAFDFVRVEDLTVSKTRRRETFFTDAGAAGAESQRGRLYRLRIDPADPTRASLTLMLDGDAGDDLVNPDNLDISERVAVIQEDRNAENRGPEVAGGYAPVLVYDLHSGRLRPVARVTTDLSAPGAQPGSWESSGAVDASGLYGRDWWLLDVQSHSAYTRQPGPRPGPQLQRGRGRPAAQAIRIPDST
jgi:hypothetical protein